ncbi:MAG: hypothetical protein ACRCSN_08475 [Dermatophilaceae bacterium]
MSEQNLAEAEIIAQRSSDIDADRAPRNQHLKVIVYPPGPEPTEENGYSHEADFAAVRQYMTSQGLRPTGDVRVKSIKPYGPGGLSWAVTYAVNAQSAEVAGDEEVSVVTGNEDPDGDGFVTSKTTPADGSK